MNLNQDVMFKIFGYLSFCDLKNLEDNVPYMVENIYLYTTLKSTRIKAANKIKKWYNHKNPHTFHPLFYTLSDIILKPIDFWKWVLPSKQKIFPLYASSLPRIHFVEEFRPNFTFLKDEDTPIFMFRLYLTRIKPIWKQGTPRSKVALYVKETMICSDIENSPNIYFPLEINKKYVSLRPQNEECQPEKVSFYALLDYTFFGNINCNSIINGIEENFIILNDGIVKVEDTKCLMNPKNKNRLHKGVLKFRLE